MESTTAKVAERHKANKAGDIQGSSSQSRVLTIL
jgi:hypothetical protein